MREKLYRLPFGEQARIARAINRKQTAISEALWGTRCSLVLAKAIQDATNGKVRADVLLGLRLPPPKKTA